MSLQGFRGFESHPLRQLQEARGLEARKRSGEMAELAEGARLLSEYTGKTCIAGSNPALSAIYAPVAQLDRVFDYESKGREFESRRAHHFTKAFVYYPA